MDHIKRIVAPRLFRRPFKFDGYSGLVMTGRGAGLEDLTLGLLPAIVLEVVGAQVHTVNSETTFRNVSNWLQSIADCDVNAIIDGFADNAVFELPQNHYNIIIPYLGVHHGKQEIAMAFQSRWAENQILRHECREIIAKDNVAFAVVFRRTRYIPGGVTYDTEDSHRVELNQDGKILHWKVYFDSSAEVAAYKTSIRSRLIAAIHADDVSAVKWLLEAGADPNSKDPDSGLSVLMLTACQGNSELTALLLDYAADVNATDQRAGSTALHKACQGGNVDVCRQLLDAGAFVDSVTSTTGHTPLMDALWFKQPAIVQLLLDRGSGLQLYTHYGFSLEQHFTYELSVNAHDREPLLASEKMIKDRKQSDQEKIANQQLMEAVVNGNISEVKRLLQAGAQVDERYPFVNGFNDYHTPLLVACRDGHFEIATELVRHGADVNAVEPTFGAVPLHKAVYNGHANITSLLVQHPEINLNFQGATNGYSPLHDALWHGFVECAKILLEAGARLDIRGHDNKLPLDIAIQSFGKEDQSIIPLLTP